MATWDTTTAKSQAYQNGDIYNDAGVEPKRITDKKDGETTFTVGEEVTLHYKTPTNVLTGTATYKGTITVNGVIYPVVEYELGDDTITYVVGLPFGSSDNPTTIGSHNINAVAFTVCFLPGTLISTPSGERKVEELVAGDSILIGAAGGRLERTPGCESPPNPTSTIVVPVKWVGRQIVSPQFGPADRLVPVRFAAGSLEGGGGATSYAA